MKKFITLFTFVLVTVTVVAQDSVSVLFIGNSYTGVNSLPSLVDEVTTSLGDILTFDSHTPGGQTFASHAANATVYDKIDDNPWDFVVLQAQSQEPSFPDAQVDANTLPYAIQLADSIYANNFCSRPLFYMTWGRENGDPQWQPISTFEGMNDRLRSAYMRFADSVEGSVSPVGSAWRYIRDMHPTINLYAGDGSHPSYEGSYLAACTFYASMFRKSPIGASFTGSLDPVTAEILQTAASMTVLDSLEQWNLFPMSEYTQANFEGNHLLGTNDIAFTNLSTGAQSYIWDFGDGNTSTEVNPTHTYSSLCNPCNITLIAISPCDSDTLNLEVGYIGTDEIDLNPEIASLGNGHFEITLTSYITDLTVIDASGKVVQPILNLNGVTAKLDLSELNSGLYFISIKSDKGQSKLKILR